MSMMRQLLLILILVLIIFTKFFVGAQKKFPDNFLFGIASSAYQIEGGVNTKGESIWDYHLRINPNLTGDASNGNIACDSYHKYKEDVALLSDLDVDFYRFSISWSRILPNGYSNEINPDGIRYYNDLINELKASGVEPMVTLYHWDMPKSLQDIGGWANPSIADYFEDYARIAFENFGDRVKYWVTINTKWGGYGDDSWPPLINQPGIGEYLYVRGVLLAHARVYHLYRKKYKNEQQGQIGIVVHGRWFEPATPQDEDAANRAREFHIGLFVNPIFGIGDYPELVKNRVDTHSKEQGFLRSRLPPFTTEEINYIKGSSDFLGLNIYTTFLVQDYDYDSLETISVDNDLNTLIYQNDSWPRSNSDWLRVVPWGLKKVLTWIKLQYNNPPIFITENGYSDNGELDDKERIDYLRLYLNELLDVILQDGVDVRGYAVWSLLDNFEWLSGYSERFGLYHVDFDDPNRKRTKKSSATWYKNLIRRRHLEENPLKEEL